MNVSIPDSKQSLLDEHLILKLNLHHIAYSVPKLEMFPQCIKYWNFEKHGIYMGYTYQNCYIEYVYPISDSSLIKSVKFNETILFDHFCFAIRPNDYPYNLLKVTNKFYSDLWGSDVQFFYDALNDLKIEIIWL